MMKWPAVVSLLLMALVLAPEPRAAQEYHTFQPMFNYDGCALDGAGVAWMENYIADYDLLCGDWYYNSGGWSDVPAYYAAGGVLMMWCNYNDYYTKAEQLADVTGYVLLLNEPDNPTQCNLTPWTAARTWRDFEVMMPDAQFVGPNISQHGITWLRQFIRAYQQQNGVKPQPAAWAFHHYLVPGWDSYTAAMADFCYVLTTEGYTCENIWLTEFGTCQASQYYAYANEIAADTRLARRAVFTNRNWGCLSLVNADGTLTATGYEYKRALRSPEW